MTTDQTATPATRRRANGIRWVTILGGGTFVLFGVSLATFEPYNPHLIRDIGAFQIGLGAVLLLVAFLPDAHGGALLGVGVGGAFHAVGHVMDRDLGGSPGTDIPTFALIAALMLWAGIAQLRST